VTTDEDRVLLFITLFTSHCVRTEFLVEDFFEVDFAHLLEMLLHDAAYAVDRQTDREKRINTVNN